VRQFWFFDYIDMHISMGKMATVISTHRLPDLVHQGVVDFLIRDSKVSYRDRWSEVIKPFTEYFKYVLGL